MLIATGSGGGDRRSPHRRQAGGRGHRRGCRLHALLVALRRAGSRGRSRRPAAPVDLSEILRVSIEAGHDHGVGALHAGSTGLRFGIDRYGASAPAPDLYRYFGLTAEAIAPQVLGGRPRSIRRAGCMATKVAINGFGRIGRLVARAILERARP